MLRAMTRDLPSGLLLLACALAMTSVMLLHPTGHALLAPGAPAHLGMLNRAVHGLALLATPALFLGLLGLHRRLAPSSLSTAALVAWGFGSTAIASAAVASGFVAPEVIEHIKAAEGSRVPEAFLLYTGLWNQGFAAVNVVAWAVALLLWGTAILRTGRLPAALGAAGGVVGGLVLLGFGSGHVGTDVHGFGMITFLESAWLLWLGVVLCAPERRLA
jgi:hypothetical protein